MMTLKAFKHELMEGIPNELPPAYEFNTNLNHAPKRKDSLNKEEIMALKTPCVTSLKHHAFLAPEFAQELEDYGRIYMLRYKPTYKMHARNIEEYPGKSLQAKAVMLMTQNNLDHAVAQHPDELITYGVMGLFSKTGPNTALCRKYLAEMTDEQTLSMYSGHPMGLFPSHKDAPRVIANNGMVIPNYSKHDNWEKFNALGVSQYGQMTAGSYMYIGHKALFMAPPSHCF